MNLTIQRVSSLEKIRTADDIKTACSDKKCMLGGETYSYQIALYSKSCFLANVELNSPLKDFINLYTVDDVIMDLPHPDGIEDTDFITSEPGKMPDLLTPLKNSNGRIRVNGSPRSLWVEINLPADYPAGVYPVEIIFDANPQYSSNEHFSYTQKTMIEVLGVNIPEQKTIFTQWFHTDCIASAHNVAVYSEEHWDLIDKYIKMAVKSGITMILTPVLTPPLDTGIGEMRPCTQLVKIEKNGEQYSFDFSLLKRWIELCKKNGIKYYEISHLFSQWGLEYSPNIMVTENGEEVHMFGWHVKAQSEEYKSFILQLVPELVDFLEKENVKEQCYFHLSDEPNLNHLENYRYAYELVVPLLKGCKTMDAISDFAFYETGLIPTPVTATNHIEPFLENNIENLWAYYCCSQSEDVGNRFLAMPSYRNRILGLQLYKYNIKGFLQWGYNFYYSQLSQFEINPYLTTSASFAFPSGDPFSVYPGKNEVLPSLRALIFREALQEVELCRLLESFIGKKAVVEIIEKHANMEITFRDYPRNSEFLPSLNDKIKEEIKKYI